MCMGRLVRSRNDKCLLDRQTGKACSGASGRTSFQLIVLGCVVGARGCPNEKRPLQEALHVCSVLIINGQKVVGARSNENA